MASCKFEPPARKGDPGRARFFWRIGPDQYNKTMPMKDEAAARRRLAIIEEVLLDIELGKRTIPPGVSLAEYVVSGGVVSELPAKPPAPPKRTTLKEMCDYYQENVIKDAATRYTEDIHIKHLLRVLGENTPLSKIDLARAQNYADKRQRETAKGRKTTTQGRTVVKELKTLKIVWNWVRARPSGPSVTGPVPFEMADVQFPPEHPKPPFRTWAEIEAIIKRGGLSDSEAGTLWDCLYLSNTEVRDVLAHAESASRWAFLHPMLCAAAFTGARRSELCRSRVEDWRLDDGVVHIRQKKKKDRSQAFSFRHVDLASNLKGMMCDWFDRHPGGQFAFCHDDRREVRPDGATYFLEQTLADSKWEVIKGWHIFRHSFASNLARTGTDQRYIDAWMGHHTEIRLRYQHLFPEQRRAAIESLVI